MLEDLGNIGDFLGGIGIIATFLYLAVQIRENTRQLRADAVAARTRSLEGLTEELADWMGGIINNRDVAELWFKGLADPDLLDETDRQRFDYCGSRLIQAWQSQYRRGLQAEDEETWRTMTKYIHMYMLSPGFRDFWGRSRAMYIHSFSKEVDQIYERVMSKPA